jgi:conjugative transposon TraK protein
MFQTTQTIDRAFRQVRLLAVGVVLICTVISIVVILRCTALVQTAQSKVYVLSGGKVLEAIADSRKDDVEIEAKDHVRTFHQYFFTLAPDQKVIDRNIRRAGDMADQSVATEYANKKEQRYYDEIIAGNVSQEIMVDSVVLNTNQYPYYFQCYATETITRASKITTRSLKTEGYLRHVRRSEDNPHGFLIERWKILFEDGDHDVARSLNH